MGYRSYEVLLLSWRALISLPGMTRTGSMGIISAAVNNEQSEMNSKRLKARGPHCSLYIVHCSLFIEKRHPK